MDAAASLQVALDGMILRGTVGSTVHGLHLEAQDDRDEMGVAIEPPRLALRGNPTVLLLLFTPGPLVETELGAELRALAPAFVSRKVGDRYRGYLRAQKERLLGTRGQRNVNRPELVEAHGYDTKYAMHVLRLAAQGREMLDTGRLELPLREPGRSRIRAVREGHVPWEEAVAAIEQAERDLAAAHERSTLPDAPDRERVDGWLVSAYRRSWKQRDL